MYIIVVAPPYLPPFAIGLFNLRDEAETYNRDNELKGSVFPVLEPIYKGRE